MPEGEYVEGSITEFWIKQGVKPEPQTPCPHGEGCKDCFSWSEFINGLGRHGTKDYSRASC